jgi:multidrug efflux system outer membrane protein
MIPKYARPEPPVPGTWPAAVAAEEAAPPAEIPWQEFFTDAHLRVVIETALANNRDLRIAALNVQKTEALYRIQRSDLYPDVGVQAAADRTRIPEKASEGGSAQTVSQYSVQLGTLSWELDFFGRIRSLKAAALEQYLATEEGRLAARISLIAGTARAYLALAADMENLRWARETLEAQRKSVELIRKTAEAGVVSDLDVRQAESQMEASRADLSRFVSYAAIDRNKLDLLVGAPIPPELLPDRLAPIARADALAPGLPSEVLLRRPDILGTEHELRAMNANIGAARAAFFPSISLTAGAGTLSGDLSSLFGSGTGTWTFSAQLLAPIFAGGALRANLEAAEIDREIAVARYDKAIQTAFSEVADGLALRETLVEQRDAQEALVHALDETRRLSDARYQAGLDGYLGVLIAERALSVARQALVTVRLAEQANLVTLYQALGGGAVEDPPQTGTD